MRFCREEESWFSNDYFETSNRFVLLIWYEHIYSLLPSLYRFTWKSPTVVDAIFPLLYLDESPGNYHQIMVINCGKVMMILLLSKTIFMGNWSLFNCYSTLFLKRLLTNCIQWIVLVFARGPFITYFRYYVWWMHLVIG